MRKLNYTNFNVLLHSTLYKPIHLKENKFILEFCDYKLSIFQLQRKTPKNICIFKIYIDHRRNN